jgi:hypothetical protein
MYMLRWGGVDVKGLRKDVVLVFRRWALLGTFSAGGVCTLNFGECARVSEP